MPASSAQLSAKAQRPVRRPAAKTHFEKPARSRVFDIVLIGAGFAVLGCVGFVAYRTQVAGEPIDHVLPFLAKAEETPEMTPDEVAAQEQADASGLPNPNAAKNTAPTRRKARPGEGVGDSDNTFFGRREPRSKPAPAESPSR